MGLFETQQRMKIFCAFHGNCARRIQVVERRSTGDFRNYKRSTWRSSDACGRCRKMIKEVYTDAAVNGNPGDVGLGVLVLKDGEQMPFKDSCGRKMDNHCRNSQPFIGR